MQSTQTQPSAARLSRRPHVPHSSSWLTAATCCAVETPVAWLSRSFVQRPWARPSISATPSQRLQLSLHLGLLRTASVPFGLSSLNRAQPCSSSPPTIQPHSDSGPKVTGVFFFFLTQNIACPFNWACITTRVVLYYSVAWVGSALWSPGGPPTCGDFLIFENARFYMNA